MKFSKYHALGNDYVVINPAHIREELDPDQVRLICHRNYGVGSDGILLGPLESGSCDFGLRIFNPDGSEAEKSGNGLRIFARFLWDEHLAEDRPFTVETAGGAVTCEVGAGGESVKVDMGEVRFDSAAIPVAGKPREVLNEELEIEGHTLRFCAATVGNPHCVVLSDDPTPDMARTYGPAIETDPRFPNRTNVQFMHVRDRHNIRIEIWERGAGYTLASGTSAVASAAVALRLGLCDPAVFVHMQGGSLQVRFSNGFAAAITGPVTKICEGMMADEMFRRG